MSQRLTADIAPHSDRQTLGYDGLFETGPAGLPNGR